MANNKRVNKNFYVTKVRVSHNCRFCGRLINPGDKALTINPKRESRFWLCEKCVSDIRRFHRVNKETANIAFGDEGAVFANMDFQSELAEELAERCVDEELLYRFGIYKDS